MDSKSNVEKADREFCCCFCGAKQSEVEFLIEKPGSYICIGCVERLVELLKDDGSGEKTAPYQHCSFCSFMKTMTVEILRTMPAPVKGTRVFRGPDHTICDACLDVCEEMTEMFRSGL